MRWKPKDAVAIVTGASSGIGRCLSELLVAEGATVIAVARRGERISELGTQTLAQGDTSTVVRGGRVVPIVGDITEQSVREKIVEVASSVRNGEIDLLVNNAGIGAIGPFAEATPERLRRVMEVNFFAPVELTRSLLPQLRKGRSPVICNISSVLGHRAVADKSEYCASKFALHGWSDSLRAELFREGIQVTLVSPSTTRSDFFESLIETDPDRTSASFGSWSPEQVAQAALAAIRARRSEVICSLAGKALVYADRLSPPLMNAMLRKRNES